MEQRFLGPSGVKVSRLCFGTLTIGPLQRNMLPEEGGKLLIYALEQGILFFDTAEIYGTYPHLRVLLQEYPGAVVATKSYAYDAKTAEASFEKAVKGLGREYIDVFLLHEQESIHTLRGHWKALEYFLKRKQEGSIGAVGISTHCVDAAQAALKFPQIEVVHPLINCRGVGIVGGKAEMEKAVYDLAAAGKGVYTMKALGGGHLIPDRREAIRYALGLPAQSVAVGMQSRAEVDYNVALFQGLEPTQEQDEAVGQPRRSLHVDDWCRGCGNCVESCRSGAMRIVNGKATPNEAMCTLCSYCAAACPDFNIKVL